MLIFTFDVENSDDYRVNYNNLQNFQEEIIGLLNYTINIYNKEYYLVGLINMPTDNHYSSSLINTKYENKYIRKFKNYYNDAKENNSIILEDDFSLENLNLFLKKSTIISTIYNSE